MTKICESPPSRPLIVLVAFEGVQLLDVAGPAEVFATAGQLSERADCEIAITSPSGGLIRSNAGVALQSVPLANLADRPIDTLIVGGGPERAIETAVRSRLLRLWLKDQSVRVRRIASVCSGAFVLAGAGLLAGRRVATHWAATERLAETFPDLRVDPDTLFVKDGALWTSGGVSTGIDMTLAMVAEDHGSALAQAVAQQLVLSVRRPGNQSQFSPLLAAQKSHDDRFSDFIVWVRENLHKPLDGPTLAAQAALSERSFQRKFKKATGMTPAAFVERVRVDCARSLLKEGVPLKYVAAKVGLASTTRLAAAFQRQLGLTPQAHIALHGVGDLLPGSRAVGG